MLVDRSGSTGQAVGGNRTIWEAMRDSLAVSANKLGDDDRLTLWQFDNYCEKLGGGDRLDFTRSLDNLDGPGGGTELGRAVTDVIASGAEDILVLTDGQTWARHVQGLAERGARINAILVGSGSLDASVGHLCALTGGQLFYAAGDDLFHSLTSAFSACRSPWQRTAVELEHDNLQAVRTVRGGVALHARWDDETGEIGPDDVGRFSAAIAIGALNEPTAARISQKEGICSHLTSLVLMDEAGDTTDGLSETRKIPLATAAHGIPSGCTILFNSSVMPQERELRIRFSVRMNTDHTLEGVGQQTSVTRERMRQLEAKALRKLKRPSRSRKLRSFLDDSYSPRNTKWERGAAAIRTIDWDNLAPSFLRDDFSGLTEQQAAFLNRLGESETLQGFAKSKGVDIRLLVLALLVAQFVTGSRSAERFQKKILADSNIEMMVAALKSQLGEISQNSARQSC